MTEKIVEILASVLKKSKEEVLELDKDHERYWDSLQMIEIVFCLEQELGVAIDSADIPSMKSVRSIEEVLHRSKEIS